ncbi:MAG: zf-HC2 domain-containing protein [Treponema sp.]|nr:zf-HC2 domain-containing protein [Treponema sp.]
MFTCPNKDLHSVYLDGELSDEYKAQYEKHVKECPKCQAALKKLEGARALLKADSDSISLSKRDMESSFARLQSRLSYKKVLKPLSLGDGAKNVLKDVLVGASAAAVIATVMPTKTKTVIQTSDFKPVARMTSLDMPADLKVEGAVSPASVVGFLADDHVAGKNASVVSFNSPVMTDSPEIDVASPMLTKAVPAPSSQAAASLALTSYDVFLPVESEEVSVKEKQSGFFLHLSSPLFTIDIGKED